MKYVIMFNLKNFRYICTNQTDYLQLTIRDLNYLIY